MLIIILIYFIFGYLFLNTRMIPSVSSIKLEEPLSCDLDMTRHSGYPGSSDTYGSVLPCKDPLNFKEFFATPHEISCANPKYRDRSEYMRLYRFKRRMIEQGLITPFKTHSKVSIIWLCRKPALRFILSDIFSFL